MLLTDQQLSNLKFYTRKQHLRFKHTAVSTAKRSSSLAGRLEFVSFKLEEQVTTHGHPLSVEQTSGPGDESESRQTQTAQTGVLTLPLTSQVSLRKSVLLGPTTSLLKWGCWHHQATSEGCFWIQ